MISHDYLSQFTSYLHDTEASATGASATGGKRDRTHIKHTFKPDTLSNQSH